MWIVSKPLHLQSILTLLLKSLKMFINDTNRRRRGVVFNALLKVLNLIFHNYSYEWQFQRRSSIRLQKALTL